MTEPIAIPPGTPPEPPYEADPLQVRVLHGADHGRGLLAVAFDPAGKYCVTAGMNAQLTQSAVDWEKAAPPLHWTGPRTWVAALAFHPTGQRLFSADYTGLAQAWDFPVPDAAAKPAWSQPGHQGWIRALAVSPDGNVLASAGNDRVVRLWSTADGSPLGELAGHEYHVYSLAFHPGGQLVSGDLRGIIKEWDLATKQPVRELDAQRMFVQQTNLRLGGVRSMAFEPGGRRFLCGGMSGFGSIGDGIGAATALLFDWETGLATHVLYAKESLRSFVIGVAFHPAGFLLGATGGLDQGALLFWKPAPIPPAAPAEAKPTEAKPAEPPKPPEPLKTDAFHQFKLPQSGWGLSMHPDTFHLAIAHHDNQLRYYTL